MNATEPRFTPLDLTARLHDEAMRALRAGLPLDVVIGALEHQATALRVALPVVNAIAQSQSHQPQGEIA